jgi:hydroxymethylpyrimidine/phosphomethylpyrimidine kinase
VRRVLVIAGSDSSGGAGIVRDVRTLTQLGAAARCVVTAVTAQTDQALSAMEVLPAALVRAQLEAALAAGHLGAVKIGMLGSAANVACVCDRLQDVTIPVVLDPVLSSSSGGVLLAADALAVLRTRLLPLASLLTPNIPEAATLLGVTAARDARDLEAQARALLTLGARAVLLKGGHEQGPESADLLLTNKTCAEWLRAPRVAGTRRGSGCALASAIAAGIAAGMELRIACLQAKQYINEFFQRGK